MQHYPIYGFLIFLVLPTTLVIGICALCGSAPKTKRLGLFLTVLSTILLIEPVNLFFGSEITFLRHLVIRISGATDLYQSYSGTYSFGMEHASFSPCPNVKEGNTHIENWHVRFVLDEVNEEKIDRIVGSKEYNPVTVTFTGVLSWEGHFGHEGSYNRLFLVVDATRHDIDSCATLLY